MKTFIQKIIATVSCTLLLTGVSTNAFASQGVIDDIEHALNEGNSARLVQISEEQDGYVRALAHYRHALLQKNKGAQGLFEKHVEYAINTLKKNIDADSDVLESKLLLAQLYGLKISIDGSLAAELGQTSQILLQGAKQKDKTNPRAYLFSGISKLYMPAMYGGGADAAISDLTKAIAYYPSDVSSNFHWGFGEAYVWLGLSYAKQGDVNKARVHWNKALEINPNLSWAKHLLNKLNEKR